MFSPPVIPSPPTSTIQTSNEPPRTLWMGDLDPRFDESTIRQIWAFYNRPVNVKLIRAKKNILIPCSSTSNSSYNSRNAADDTIQINRVSFIDPSTTQLHHAGYCFIEFATQQEAQFALSLNATPLPNILSQTTNLHTNPGDTRCFRLNWASGATLQSSIPSTPEYSLFVGDLAPSTTEADLLLLFQKNYTSVKTVRVMTDPMTGASRCFGFVRFGNDFDRQRSLREMNGVECHGRNLRVAPATPRNSNSNSTQRHQDTPLLLETANNLISSDLASMPSPDEQPPTSIFVGGLNPYLTEPQLQMLFAPFGNIVSVNIPVGKNCGFVKFAHRIDAEAAIQGMQGFIVGGSPLRLSWARAYAEQHMPPPPSANYSYLPPANDYTTLSSFTPRTVDIMQQQERPFSNLHQPNSYHIPLTK